ncbi:MAG: membrane protein FxsA [Methyloligella sp.]|nr:MAG: membrane protein FxsA [Methyloligella sp.]
MGLVFFALFLLVPIIEIVGFMQIGSLIGLWPTLGVVILTAIAGSMLLRHQGMTVLFRTQSMIQEGKIPVDEMIDGICLAIAGALLLTPGFFTDIFGFLLFIPPFRRTLATTVFKKYILPRTTFFANSASFSGTHSQYSSDDFQDTHFQDNNHSHSNSMDDGPIIDGEFTEADSKKSKNPSDKSRLGSPWNDNEDLGNKHK